jgi:hypothetical protein
MMRSQEMGAVTAYAAPGPTHIFRLSIAKTRQGFAWGGRESSDGFNQDVAHTVQVMANEVNREADRRGARSSGVCCEIGRRNPEAFSRPWPSLCDAMRRPYRAHPESHFDPGTALS